MKSKNISNGEEAYFSLLEYAFDLVSKKRYTAAGMRKKLTNLMKKREVVGAEEEVQKVVDRLLELKYLDDFQYALDFINDRQRFKPRGGLLIEQELKVAGVNGRIIKEAIESVFDEENAAKTVFEKNARRLGSYEKAYGFLVRKGFRKDIIYRTLKSCYNRSNDADLDY